MKTRKGFMLIELLAVIAIITILTAILSPAFVKAREKAGESVCISNEKQIGRAMQMYLDEYNKTFFTFSYTVSGSNVVSNWPEFLEPYIMSMTLFACPISNAVPKIGHPYVCNYGGNMNFSYSGLIKMSQVTAPASTLFLYEDQHEDWWCYTNQANYTNLWTKGLTATWHNEGCNILMVDGHVKWVKTSGLPVYHMGDPEDDFYVWQGITWLPYPSFPNPI